MSGRVFITGLGMISACGNNVKEVLESILALKTGIADINYLSSVHKNAIPVCEVKLSNEQLGKVAEVEGVQNFTRSALLGIIAAKEALKSAGIENVNELRTGLISATTVGGMDRSENFYNSFFNDKESGKLIDIVNHDCGDSTERIADALGIKEFVTTISTACSSSANSIMFGARLIKNNILDRVVVGGTDALTRFTLNGFNSLMILDPTGCKPFDENRAGLTIGEGSGFIVIESEKAIKASGKKVYCELTGYGNACDAFHQTASSPDGNGAFLAMEKALKLSGLKADEIDYINVHGTGTSNNDLSEGIAIDRIFSGNVPKFSSTKPFTGHTLGATGGIEAVLSILAIENGIVYPNLRFTEQMKELNFKPNTELITHCEVNHVLSNSFGFGGNNSSLIFSKC